MAKRKKQDEPQENPRLLERGQKQRAGRLLSEYLRGIGQEMTEIMPVESRDSSGKVVRVPTLMSRAESLARWMWFRATPHKNAEGDMVEPDLDVVKLVLDRVEGKPSVQGQEDVDSKIETVPDRVARMSVDRLNAIAEEAAE